ncbi:MAG TPA: NrfD/PsrC family molybdoenzyme membrane anchor subunit [Thermoanaerobaculia bacterium]|nr:NrfD/PsrC family molybdoenzyme membrane anchor subunit [Thermoanaerobaculia bacterium]
MDDTLIGRGLKRTPLPRFLLWLVPWAALLALGLYAVTLCFAVGLNQTNMDNRFAFGLWIYLDLTVIALGAGAFFTGFLLYILKRQELKAVINSAVVIGFICYSGAVGILMVDVGQPLRAWFTFWHPNVHSMLAEVTFCLTLYLSVLAIEYAPLVLKNRRVKEVPGALVLEHQLHKVMVVFAGIGTLLSFFHQGSLGGLYGVLRGNPFAFREHIGIWPTTFFLFILSAAAVGPSFILLTTWLVGKVSRKRLVSPEVFQTLAKISGSLLLVYVVLKGIDSLVWINATSPKSGVQVSSFYAHPPFGTWVLFAEVVLLGLLPAVLLLSRRVRARTGLLVLSAALACAGVVLNRYVMTIQTLALPSLPFDSFLSYSPSWQETAAFLAVLGYGVLLYSISFRWLNLFPEERELATKG